MKMEIDDDNGCNGTQTKKKPLALDWNRLLRTTSSGDDDDRSPELIIATSSNKSEGSGGEVHAPLQEDQHDDLELMIKTDHEINESISRQKKSFQVFYKRLPDKGEKLMATIRRYEIELQRRNKLKLEKAENGCEETIQLSDHSDDSASCGEMKSGQKSSSSKSQLGAATNDSAVGVTEHDSLTDGKMQKIVNELLNVGISEIDVVGKAAEVCYNDPIKVKVLFALPSHMRKSYVYGFLYPQI